MGVDVNLYAEGEVTDEELAAAEALFSARSMLDHYDGSYLSRAKYSDVLRVERNTLSRFYGEGYERGPWPAIYGDILLMRAAFPNCTIHYGGDGSDDCPEATDDYLADIWAHFVGPNGDAYRTRPL